MQDNRVIEAIFTTEDFVITRREFANMQQVTEHLLKNMPDGTSVSAAERGASDYGTLCDLLAREAAVEIDAEYDAKHRRRH